MSVSSESFVSRVWKTNIFANKVVFCTGGRGSICSAQVRALVYLGANACITGHNEEKTRDMAQDIEKTHEGSMVLPLIVDVRNGKDSSSREMQSRARHSHSAGAAGNFLASMNRLFTNAFKSGFDIDVLGYYNTVKASLPYLLEYAAAHQTLSGNVHPNGTGGCIIFVSATLHYTGQPMQTHIMAAKAGVDALSTSVAIEQGPRGITSDVIAPGGIAGTGGLSRLTEKGQDL
ncbi:hypothetical protein V496_05442 [Pseudogymnoascus sp. VKM F-4515 (FW-2607)]|nr:hypothetical protein V496_05442 [Pseudogymnoascus sp. VKM F-4515 (FW-2607)]